MYGALHPKSDVDRLYIKRKEGGRSLMSVELSEETSRRELLRLRQSVLKIL